LDIAGTGVTDLSALYNKEMRELDLSLSDQLNNAALSNWKNSLNTLSLYNCGGKDISWLKDYKNLTGLYLYVSRNSRSYDEEADPLTGLEFLSELHSLNSLSLYGLGDASSLESVKSLKKLNYVSFSMNDRDTEIPEDLITELKNSLPNCTFSY
jgi:hypothetical protein